MSDRSTSESAVRRSIELVLSRNPAKCDQSEWALRKLLEEEPELKWEIIEVMKSREGIISKLKSIFTLLRKFHRCVNIVKIVGTLINIAGGVLALIGLGMTPLTCCTSLVLTLIGGGLFVVGSSINGIGSLAESMLERKSLKEACTLIGQDDKQIARLEEAFPKFKSLHPEILSRVEVVLVDLKEDLLQERKGLFAPLVRKVATMKKFGDTKLQQLEDNIYTKLHDFVDWLHYKLQLSTEVSDNCFTEKAVEFINIQLPLLIDNVYVLIKKFLHYDDPSLEKSTFSTIWPFCKDGFSVTINNPRKVAKLCDQIIDIIVFGLREVKEAQKAPGFVSKVGAKIFRCAMAGRIIAICLQTAMGIFTALGLVIDIGNLGALLYEVGAGSASKEATKVLDHAYRLEIEQALWRRAIAD